MATCINISQLDICEIVSSNTCANSSIFSYQICLRLNLISQPFRIFLSDYAKFQVDLIVLKVDQINQCA